MQVKSGLPEKVLIRKGLALQCIQLRNGRLSEWNDTQRKDELETYDAEDKARLPAGYLRVIIVAVFKDLALNGGIFAAAQEDERRVPAGEIFHPSGVLHAVKLSRAGWGSERLSQMVERVFAAQNNGELPRVSNGDRGDGGVDDGRETGQRQRGFLESMRVCGSGGGR